MALFMFRMLADSFSPLVCGQLSKDLGLKLPEERVGECTQNVWVRVEVWTTVEVEVEVK